MTDIHGGNIYRRPINLDFSANINPLGMPNSVKKAYHAAVDMCEKYPDHNCTELKKAIAEYECFSVNSICVGNGAADLIYRIVHTFKPKKCVLTSPCFSEYQKALNEINSEITFYPISEINDFDLQDDFADTIDDETDMVFLTSPNNPTGRIVSNDILKTIAEKCHETNTIIVADECFLDFVNNGSKYSIRHYMNENIIILKAFTKIFAMPGIRLGYALCGDFHKAEMISENGQYWSVSTVAQNCGIAALRENDYIRKTVEMISVERHFLENELRRLNLKVFKGYGNFILFKGSINLDLQLIEKGILVRNCENYHGLSDRFYRVAVRSHVENAELIKILGGIIYG